MDKDPTDWWTYFSKKNNNKDAQCNFCDWLKPRGPTKPTSKLKLHLSTAHPEEYKKKLDGEKAKEIKEAARKRQHENQMTIFTALNVQQNQLNNLNAAEAVEGCSSNSNEPAIKKPRLCPIFLTEWDTEKTLTIDRKIAEIFQLDLQPFSFVEDEGFSRLITALAPGYKLKKRQYYSTTILPKIFNDVFNLIKSELLKAKYISFTTDEWSDKCHRHSLLSLTAHFLDENMQPKYFILDARPIDGSHTAENYVQLLNDSLDLFGIDHEKVHIFMRDAQSTMKKTTRLMEVENFDCLAHKMQLAIKDGFQSIDNFKSLLEKGKKAVRKVRKSQTLLTEFKNLQQFFDLPERMLIKECDVRWNTIYLMLNSLLQNRRPLSIMAQNDEKFPKFDDLEWCLIDSICKILEPIYLATKEVENRRCSISSYIPIVKTIICELDSFDPAQQADDTIPLNNFRIKISDGLKRRVAQCGWEQWSSTSHEYLPGEKRNKTLVLSTILDPRYKLELFEDERIDDFRDYLEMAATEVFRAEKIEKVPEIEIAKEPTLSGFFSLMQKQKANRPRPNEKENFIMPTSPSNLTPPSPGARTIAIVQVSEYLNEPVQHLAIDPFNYWKNKRESGKWDLLCQLAEKYLSAPCGSVESERLFSKAGLICTELRNRLKSENLRKLLFLNNNLLIIDYDY